MDEEINTRRKCAYRDAYFARRRAHRDQDFRLMRAAISGAGPLPGWRDPG